MGERCQWQGERQATFMGRDVKRPYRCESEGTWQDPSIPGDWYCPKHERLVKKQRAV